MRTNTHSFSTGHQGEKFIIDLFNRNGIDCHKNNDKEKKYDYDLVCKLDKEFTCEVKFDKMAQTTGNIAIEHHNSKQDKPSGITVTKADLWIYVLMDDINLTAWGCNTSSLQKFIKNNTPFKKISRGGDNNAELYLYKEYDLLNNIFIRLETLPKDKFTKTIKDLLK